MCVSARCTSQPNSTGRWEASGARVTPGCWPKLPPIMIIRRRLTCYNSLWDEFPLNAHLLTIHLAAANLYTYIKGAHIEMGLAAAAAAAALHLSRLPRLRAEIDFEARVQFTIGLNSRIAYCDAGRNFKRNAAELNFCRVWLFGR